jgi:1-acyl-sn-glycerol-3-phosphate acyltransferase
MLFRIGYWLLRRIVGAVMAALGGLRVEGREHVPDRGGVILAANHVSYLDPSAVGLAMPYALWYMAKEPLFRIPVLNRLMRFFRAFPVRSDAADRGALRQAAEILEDGGTLVVFPEGSCSRTGDLLPFRPGLALIALRSRAPIVPTAVIGTERALPPDVYRPRRVPGGLVVRFGPPIDPADLPPGLERKEQLEALTERVELAIRALLNQPDTKDTAKATL